MTEAKLSELLLEAKAKGQGLTYVTKALYPDADEADLAKLEARVSNFASRCRAIIKENCIKSGNTAEQTQATVEQYFPTFRNKGTSKMASNVLALLNKVNQ